MTTPPPPKSGKSSVTVSGPRRAAPPAPVLRMASAAPLSLSATIEGMSAESGTNPASTTP